jgi:hypothetical protein
MPARRCNARAAPANTPLSKMAELPSGYWFVGWDRKDFARWLRTNYPRPKLPLDTLQLFEIHIHDKIDGYSNGVVAGYGYIACVNGFAKLLESTTRNGRLLDGRFEIVFCHGNAANERLKVLKEEDKAKEQ